MINSWIVIRHQIDIDSKYCVCLEKKDALMIANLMADYWIKEYGDSKKYNTETIEDLIFNCTESNGLFSIHVQPQKIIGKDGE